MKKIIEKYKEIITYIIFGVLTTVVNFAAFWIFTRILGDKLYLLNNAIAWIISVIFAYITNKLFVFESKSFNSKIIIKEISEFFLARVLSFLIEEGGLLLFVSVLKFDRFSFEIFSFEVTGQLISKVILAVIVVILNYFFSKFIIFKNKENNK